jgi:HEAT repeat protein
MQLFGPPNVAKLKASRDIKGLVKALDYKKDSNVRREAAIALKELKNARSVEPLVDALKDENAFVRDNAAEALGEICARSEDVALRACVVETLVTAFQNKEIGLAAVTALGKIGDARAVTPLITALEDKEMRFSAAQALEKIGWKPGKDEFGIAFWIGKRDWDECAKIGVSAVEPLIAALKDKELCAGAARALGQIGDVRALEPLISALNDNVWYSDEVSEIAGALKKMGTSAVESLIKVLEGDDEEMCLSASWSLGQIGDTRAIEPLIDMLDHRRWERGRAAARALGTLKDSSAIEALIAALAHHDSRVSDACREALIKIGTPVVEPLIAALKDRNKSIRYYAIQALSNIGDPRAVEPIIVFLKDTDWTVRGDAAEALGILGDTRAVRPLIDTLKDNEELVRKYVVEALGKIGWRPGKDDASVAYWVGTQNWDKCISFGKRAVAPLTTALKHGEIDIRWHAAKALEDIGWQPGMDETGAAYWVVKQDYEKCVAIGELATLPLVNVLRFKDWSPHAAVDALKKIGAPATKRMLAALNDMEMCAAAVKALEQTGWKPGNDEASALYWVIKQWWDECAEIGAPAVEPLVAALEDQESEVRIGAARALGMIGAQMKDAALCNRAIDILLEEFDQGRVEMSHAVRGLGVIGAILDDTVLRTRIVETLLSALQESDWDVREAAAGALGKIGDARAIEPLLSALNRTISREVAAQALISLSESGKIDEAHKKLINAHRSEIEMPPPLEDD